MNRMFVLEAQTGKRWFQLMSLLMAFACSSFGSTIKFTDITTASGTIGSTSFTNEPITTSAVGIEGLGGVGQWGPPFPPVVTSGGTLVLDTASPDVTFSAQVVPEPGTFLLLAGGLLGVGRFVKHRIAS